MKLISFYFDTDNSNFYKNSAIKLIENCKDLDVNFHIVNEKLGSNWIENVRAKPFFILKMFEIFQEDLIWLDVDCKILKKFDLELNSNWMCSYNKKNVPNDYIHILKKNDYNKNFLKKWISEIEKQKKGSHSAFISLQNENDIIKIPNGYFELGISKVESKKKYLNEQ